MAVERKRTQFEGEQADGSVVGEFTAPIGKVRVRWATPDDVHAVRRVDVAVAAGDSDDDADSDNGRPSPCT